MVAFSEDVIAEIMTAVEEEELRKIIENSFLRLIATNSFNTENYRINMIVSLQAKKGEHLSPDGLKNINAAIRIFREHKGNNQGLLF